MLFSDEKIAVEQEVKKSVEEFDENATVNASAFEDKIG
jgi:hypothetical protein